jgi:hypothetical protein
LALLPRLGTACADAGLSWALLIVDDGSRQTAVAGGVKAITGPAWIKVLRLRRNVGHQRAIAIGLCHVRDHYPADAIVVMDGDGEDRPEDVPLLVAELRRQRPAGTLVFAERQRRVEGLIFRCGYLAYRVVHRLLTGRGIRVGNFSAMPFERLDSLTTVSELWIHYAAAVVRSRQPWSTVPIVRGTRINGTSKMSLVALVVHGLSAISVYSDEVLTRVVVAASACFASALVALGLVFAVKLASMPAVPGWATYVTAILLVILLQTASVGVSLILVTLAARQQAVIVPQRDYLPYVADVTDLSARSSDS